MIRLFTNLLSISKTVRHKPTSNPSPAQRPARAGGRWAHPRADLPAHSVLAKHSPFLRQRTGLSQRLAEAALSRTQFCAAQEPRLAVRGSGRVGEARAVTPSPLTHWATLQGALRYVKYS